MNNTKTMGLRLPVQAAVDRTATGGALAGGTGVEAADWTDILKTIGSVAGPILGSFL